VRACSSFSTFPHDSTTKLLRQDVNLIIIFHPERQGRLVGVSAEQLAFEVEAHGLAFDLEHVLRLGF